VVWQERLRALQAPVGFSAVNGQFGASGLRRGNKRTSIVKAWLLGLHPICKAEACRLFLAAAASVLLTLQLQSGYAQNARQQVGLDAQTTNR
jgi:hypothetical protein